MEIWSQGISADVASGLVIVSFKDVLSSESKGDLVCFGRQMCQVPGEKINLRRSLCQYAFCVHDSRKLESSYVEYI